MRRIITILSVIYLLAACTNDKTSTNSTIERNDDQFLEESQIGIYINNEAVKQFDEKSEQIIYDDQKSFYMVTDINCNTYYSIEIEGDMVLDGEVIALCNNNNIEKLDSNSITMSIVKIDVADKLYWLWNSELEIGYILDFDIQ